MKNNKYTPIIGLEVHVELKTKSKMFCGCSADYFGKAPNSHTCPVCLGLPGALPVPNRLAIEWCIKIALSLNCKINTFSKFDRKNYFYPDLAKGYQISQYDLPFGHDGYIELKNKKRIRIRRVHMEEDTGKLMHQDIDSKKTSLIDFNRSGLPLVEMVTEPDFRDALEVKEYLQRLQQIIRFLEVSDADMEKGEMRLEPNISLSIKSTGAYPLPDKDLPKYKVEVKNINSFKFVEKAINYEIKRHKELLDKSETPAQETRGWDENRQKTFSQRAKEEAHDYRYFPEPDIPPILHTKEQISNLMSQMPELQDEMITRFIREYNLSAYDSEILTREKKLATYFEDTAKIGLDHKIAAKNIANIIINQKIDIEKVLPATLIKTIVSSHQTIQVDEEELKKIIIEVLSENEKAVKEYKSGKDNALMFLLGQVMKKLGKKVDVTLVKKMILEKLK
ncbi:MAG TPA: Asp-tRNA(Asn)/Glu-tRNA(Gln) amidotransferase subunit GatB [Candidatus Limnocylindrales bacterium]|nr:Asp-tRNA(Asn)/Glu-tRNA(Gln) amidotransferase subunit GatB [Candidatus Limnocylindrales bacterium]